MRVEPRTLKDDAHLPACTISHVTHFLLVPNFAAMSPTKPTGKLAGKVAIVTGGSMGERQLQGMRMLETFLYSGRIYWL